MTLHFTAEISGRSAESPVTGDSDGPRAILKVKAGDSPDDVYAAVLDWATEQGLELYPHQDEAILELLGGANVVLATPTGSGKSLVAVAAHAAALARDRVTFYTAPIKALVSEKFFELCEIFGADDVGMLTGDASVNPTPRSSAARPRSWPTSRSARARGPTSGSW